MFKQVIRPLLFSLSAEHVHNLALSLLGVCGYNRTGRWLLRRFYTLHHPSLEREVFGVKFPNPIGVAAGYDKNGALYRTLGSMGFGFVEIGTLTPKPQTGNRKPRLFRLPKDNALVNRMGFNNSGLDKALEHLRRRATHHHEVVLGANIAKNTHTSPQNAVNDYLRMFRSLYQYVEYFTINVSTLVGSMGLSEQQENALLNEILAALFDFRHGQTQFRPILLKISPDWNMERVDRMIGLLIDTQLDGLVVAGTTQLRPASLQTSARQLKQTGNGGLSGEPLLERTLELIRYINERIEGRYPIIGVGGIMNVEDAQRMLDAGASLVQLYTGLVYNGPTFPKRICRYMTEVAHIKERLEQEQAAKEALKKNIPSTQQPAGKEAAQQSTTTDKEPTVNNVVDAEQHATDGAALSEDKNR